MKVKMTVIEGEGERRQRSKFKGIDEALQPPCWPDKRHFFFVLVIISVQWANFFPTPTSNAFLWDWRLKSIKEKGYSLQYQISIVREQIYVEKGWFSIFFDAWLEKRQRDSGRRTHCVSANWWDIPSLNFKTCKSRFGGDCGAPNRFPNIKGITFEQENEAKSFSSI